MNQSPFAKFRWLFILLCICLPFYSGTDRSNLYGQNAEDPNAENTATPSFFRFDRIEQAVKDWNADQHLYMQGDLGLDRAKLVELEAWLRQNGDNWTIILMQNAGGQRYVNEDGRVENGMDAVELAVSDLMEVGSFRNQRIAGADEPAGAVFVLFLDERKFSYRASDAQNRRDLGQDHWIGRLDRPAFRAMRGGGRIADAVRDTVTSVNDSLRRTIGEEVKLEAERERSRQLSVEAVKARLRQVNEKLAMVQSSAQSVKQSLPDASADLTEPKISELSERLAKLESEVAADNTNIALLRDQSGQLLDEADDWLNRYDEFAKFDESHAQLEQRLEELRNEAGDLLPNINASLTEVEEMLKRARENHDAANSEFQKNLNAATHALESSSELLESERANQNRLKARQAFIRRTIGIAASILGLAFAAILFWLNRRRVPAKKRALQRLDQRREEVKAQIEGVSELLKRSDLVIGDRAAIKRKGYAGTTKELSERAISDVDDLLVLSGSVEKVMNRAADLISPGSSWRKFSNWWSADNYNTGFDLLENQPIEFDESDGISLVAEESELSGTGSTGTEDSAEGITDDSNGSSKEHAGKISLSFADLFKVFRNRAARVTATIDEVETAWTQIVSTNAELQDLIDSAYEAEQLAREATEKDGLFSVPQIFDDLLKSAQQDQDLSEEIGKHDPISAIAGPAASGIRKASNAKALATQLVTVRQALLPAVRDQAAKLEQRSRLTEWIDAALVDFRERAVLLATTALKFDVANEITEWRKSFENFTKATARAVELHDQSAGEVTEKLSETSAFVESSRNRIAEKLQLSPESVLIETDHSVSDMLEEALKHNLACLASLDRGDPPAAELSIAEALEWDRMANETVNASLHILDHLPQEIETIENRLQELSLRLPESESRLHDMQNEFADAALMIEGAAVETEQMEASKAAFDIARPVSGRELVEVARRQQDRSRESISRAAVLYREGKLLAAEDQHTLARNLAEQSFANLDLLKAHGEELQRLSREVESQAEQLRSRFSNLQAKLVEHHVVQATIASAESFAQQLSQLKFTTLGGNVRRDPNAEANVVTQLAGILQGLFDQTEVDLRNYQEAKRSVEALEGLIDESRSVVQQAQNDRIADSVATQRGIASLRDAGSKVENLRERLRTPHDQWLEVDRSADSILAEASNSLAKVRSELDQAQRAADAIQSAGNEYHRAASWTGDYGVRANPQSTRDSIEQARMALARGNYDQAIAIASQSISAVQQAIAIAENEVNRRRAAERREKEQRRRSRMAGVGGGIIGGLPGISSSGGSRSSSRRTTSSRSTSSRSSSGSSSSSRSSSGGGRGGFSRSGW